MSQYLRSGIFRIPDKATHYLRHRNDEWRKHPYLQYNWQSVLPGIQYGAAAAVVYELTKTLFFATDEHHGHHNSDSDSDKHHEEEKH